MLFCFILAIYVHFVLFFQYSYSQNITVESDDIPYEYIYHLNVTTNSIECEFCDTTICKGSYCFTADREFGLPFIEIPINTNTSRLNDNSTDCKIYKHSKNKVNRYILHPYVYYHDPYIHEIISTNCTQNYQCFTNKCVNNICTFNEDDIITRCRYGRCGRFIKDPCLNKYDCSEGECNGVCYLPDTPERSKYDDPLYQFCVFLEILGFLIFIAIIGICYCCCARHAKSKKAKSHYELSDFNSI